MAATANERSDQPDRTHQPVHRSPQSAWRPITIAAALAEAAHRWPQAEALVMDGTRLTYAALWRDVRIAAANLKALGVRRGHHVAICMGNGVPWVRAAYAAATLGATIVPVNTRFRQEELRYCLEQSDTRCLIVADRFMKMDFVAMLRAIAPSIDAALPDPALPALAQVLVLGDDVPRAALPFAVLERAMRDLPDEASEGVSVNDVGLMQYTSGTTSYPKGVMLSHASLLRDAWEASHRMGIGPGDRYFSARPLFHVSGTVLSMLLCLMSGACYLTTPSFDPGAALRILEAEGCTHTSANDTMFLALMNHPDFPQRRLRVRGGLAAAAYPVMQQIHDRMGIHGICAGYGLSESAPNVALSPYDDTLERRLAGYAYPLPEVEVRIVDPASGADQPAGTAGEILVRGWGLMQGYYKMPEATARAIDAHGWLHTGDLGMLDADGRLLFMDRLKDMFRVGGENVAPADVENWLNQHPAIKQAQVVGVPDLRLMEVAAAFVVLKNAASATEAEIITWCRERMAGFKVPRYVRFVASFDPIGMTASAKIQRNKLREYALDQLGLRPETKT